MKYLISAAILLPMAFSGTLALADDHGRTMDSGMMGGGMMGGGRGSMMGGDRRDGMMGGGMAGCMQMMQSGSQRPNEQWRQR